MLFRSFSFSAASATSTPIPSMASGSNSFKGFPFGSGHIHHSTPSLGSLPFISQAQGFNPWSGGQSSTTFIGWNPIFTASGARNQFLAGQHGNVPFPSSITSQAFSPFENSWNPYQGVSSPFTTSVRGNDPVYSHSILSGGGVLL